MKKATAPADLEPTWLDPRNDRKTPYSEADLEVLADDFIAMNSDTQAWQNRAGKDGEQRARQLLKQRLAGRDPKSLINWKPNGPSH